MDAMSAYAQIEGRKSEIKWMITCYKSEGNGFLYSIVTADDSWVHHFYLEMKSSWYVLIPAHPTKRKFQDSNFCWKIHAHHFLGQQKHHPRVVLGQRYENQL